MTISEMGLDFIPKREKAHAEVKRKNVEFLNEFTLQGTDFFHGDFSAMPRATV